MDRTPQWHPPQPASFERSPFEPATQPAAPELGAPPEPPPYIDQRPPLIKRLLGPLVVAGAFLAKFGKLALVGLKGAKFLTTSATMLVSIAAYGLIWGLPFAAGFVALLFVHEFGHWIQLRREGVRPSGMVFIPFLGAAVGARSLGGNALAEARVGLAGPILGSLATAGVAAAGFALDSDMLKALAFTGFFLNLFNLMPVMPLDGGRAMAAMAPWMWFLGLGAMVTLMFVWPNPIIILITLFAVMETYRRWKGRKAGEEGNAEYYRVSGRARLVVGAVYLALIAALVLGMDATHVARDFSQI
jgi:Zn-dependent protease